MQPEEPGTAAAPEHSSQAPLQPLPQRILLAGFMGAGKSTVGPLLARQLQWSFLDLDSEIEAATGATVAQIFATHGEPHFRQLEHATIQRLLASQSLVLALGGGAIEDPRTRALLLDPVLAPLSDPDATGSLLIHLEASFETALLRCQGTDALRPVLADRTNLEARYHRRLPLYRQAHLTIPVDDLTPEAVVEAILARLQFGPQSHPQSNLQSNPQPPPKIAPTL